MRHSKPKPANQPTPVKSPAGRARQAGRVEAGETSKVEGKHSSKQDQVIAMLQSPSGTTLSAMMKTTGWQQHSVRGFLSGTIRKKLKLKLISKKIDGDRVYRVTRGGAVPANTEHPSPRKA